jgi:hypothetical protein
MSEIKNLPFPANESITITIVGDQNMAPSDPWAMPASNVCSFTMSGDVNTPSAPLSEGAVRVGNSILSAVVPEQAILRDWTGEL